MNCGKQLYLAEIHHLEPDLEQELSQDLQDNSELHWKDFPGVLLKKLEVALK